MKELNKKLQFELVAFIYFGNKEIIPTNVVMH